METQDLSQGPPGLRADLAVAVPSLKEQDEAGVLSGVGNIDVKLVVADRVFLERIHLLAGKEPFQIIEVPVLSARKIAWRVEFLLRIPVKIVADLIIGELVRELARINQDETGKATDKLAYYQVGDYF